LRGLAVRSRRVLLESLREGAARGLIRGDLDPELLLVPVMGTIHALIGMPGVHRTAAKGRPRTERVLAALLRMLAPPIPRTVDDTDRRESP
jgi:hypothetical protein